MITASAFRLAGPFALALAIAGAAHAQCFATRLVPDKPRPQDWLGTDVAISGTRAVLATTRDQDYDNGRVVVFERSGATEWSEVTSIEDPHPTDSDWFGASVAIDGDFVAVGAPLVGANNVGRVYIYRRLVILGNPFYVLDEAIDAPGPSTDRRFGFSVDLAVIGSTLTLAVGGPWSNPGDIFQAGRARIFTRNSETGAWTLQDTVTANTPSEEADFGTSVDLDSSGRLVVGAPGEHVQQPGTSPGAAYLFTKSGNDWGTGFRLAAPDEFVRGTDLFGMDVAIWGSWIAVGAPGAFVDSLNAAGAVYLYQRFGSTALWLFSDRLDNPNPNQGNQVGRSVAMRDGVLVSGDPDSLRVLCWRRSDSEWYLSAPFSAPELPPGTHRFGLDVALSSDGAMLLAGDRNDSGSGAGYIFTTELNPATACPGGFLDPVPFVEDGGSYYACNNYSETDGASCGTTNSDVWYQFTAPCNGVLALSTCGTHDMGSQDSGIDTVLSIHSGCPGTIANMLVCNNNASTGNWPDACGLFGDLGVERDAAVKLGVTSGQNYRIRVASNGSSGPSGLFVLRSRFTCCLADWDGNGTVNSTDVSSFINDWFEDQANGTLVTDFDNNGVVNSTDISMFINEWFVGCEV